ncbi:hypothetical protein [Terrisporobacter sp.]|uniref:hypothetical protein n=1 Tax=Terrisporobacter sp. TaxID=1965305 RepID=UPI0028A02044|nr:hypothetical protein [Terrisporobacter sp.]
MNENFKLICSKCGKEITLNDKFNSIERDKYDDIELFTLRDGTICIHCDCGNEIYSDEIY